MSQTMKTLNGYEIVDNYARTQITAEKAALKQEIATERKRIDALASLPEGSTAGDAELVDAHIDYTGKNWESTGAHIRGVTSQLSEQIDDLFTSVDVITDELEFTTTSGKIINGVGKVEDVTNTAYEISSFIDISNFDKLIISASTRYDNCIYAFYSEPNDNSVIGRKNGDGTNEITTIIDEEVIVPNGANYILVANYNKSVILSVKSNVGYAPKGSDEMKEKITDMLSEYDFDVTEIEPNVVNNKCILNRDSSETETNSTIYKVASYLVSDYRGKEVVITASANYGNTLYTITDDSGNVIEYKQSNGVKDYTDYHKQKIIIPSNAYRLKVAYSMSCRYGYMGVVKGYSYKKWLGKKWCVVGDSLTEHNETTKKCYHDYISEATGIEIINRGVSGSGYKRLEGENVAFHQRISNIPTDVDVVTIFGSLNDLGGNYTIGNVTDIDTTTICGCINTTIDNLYNVCPTVQLGIITPTPWLAYEYLGGVAEEYVNALVTICKNRGIPCLDLYHQSNLRPWDSTFRNLAYKNDNGGGTHPDEVGHKIIASRIMNFVDSLLI